MCPATGWRWRENKVFLRQKLADERRAAARRRLRAAGRLLFRWTTIRSDERRTLDNALVIAPRAIFPVEHTANLVKLSANWKTENITHMLAKIIARCPAELAPHTFDGSARRGENRGAARSDPFTLVITKAELFRSPMAVGAPHCTGLLSTVVVTPGQRQRLSYRSLLYLTLLANASQSILSAGFPGSAQYHPTCARCLFSRGRDGTQQQQYAGNPRNHRTSGYREAPVVQTIAPTHSCRAAKPQQTCGFPPPAYHRCHPAFMVIAGALWCPRPDKGQRWSRRHVFPASPRSRRL